MSSRYLAQVAGSADADARLRTVVGAAYRPLPALTFALDYQRVTGDAPTFETFDGTSVATDASVFLHVIVNYQRRSGGLPFGSSLQLPASEPQAPRRPTGAGLGVGGDHEPGGEPRSGARLPSRSGAPLFSHARLQISAAVQSGFR
jgi:hypothetical protein